MPRRRSAPRLYLDPKRKTWVIRDGAIFIRTGNAEAETREAEGKLAAYIRAKYQPAAGPDPSIADVLLLYARDVVAHNKGRDAFYFLDGLAKWWGDKRSSSVTTSSCQAFAATRTASLARRELEVLRAALRHWAKEKGGAAPGVWLPPKEPPRDRWLTREEAKRLRKAAMRWPHLYRFVAVGLMTGTRSGAILKMRWDWVDLDACLMHRRRAGEAEDARKRTPPVRISRRLARLMRRWKRDGCPYVVHYHGQPITRRIDKSWQMAVRAAGLDRSVTPHCLRRTRATWLAQAGIPIWEAAGSLGMDANTFSRHYGKHHPDYQRQAAEV